MGIGNQSSFSWACRPCSIHDEPSSHGILLILVQHSTKTLSCLPHGLHFGCAKLWLQHCMALLACVLRMQKSTCFCRFLCPRPGRPEKASSLLSVYTQ